MGNIGEEVIAIPFARPKMSAMLFPFFGLIGKEVFAKPQNDYFPRFKFEVFSRQKNAIARNKGQDPLIIHWEPFLD